MSGAYPSCWRPFLMNEATFFSSSTMRIRIADHYRMSETRETMPPLIRLRSWPVILAIFVGNDNNRMSGFRDPGKSISAGTQKNVSKRNIIVGSRRYQVRGDCKQPQHGNVSESSGGAEQHCQTHNNFDNSHDMHKRRRRNGEHALRYRTQILFPV